MQLIVDVSLNHYDSKQKRTEGAAHSPEMPFAAARWFPSIFHSPEMSFSAVTWFPATLAH